MISTPRQLMQPTQAQPAMLPTMPPKRPRVKASMMIIPTILRRRRPMAIMVPISRVRSNIESNIVLATPTSIINMKDTAMTLALKIFALHRLPDEKRHVAPGGDLIVGAQTLPDGLGNHGTLLHRLHGHNNFGDLVRHFEQALRQSQGGEGNFLFASYLQVHGAGQAHVFARQRPVDVRGQKRCPDRHGAVRWHAPKLR